jgi:Rieske Fe-S protein
MARVQSSNGGDGKAPGAPGAPGAPADVPLDEGRRDFCRLCIGGLSCASAAMVGYPIVSFLAMPERLGASKPLEVPLASLSAGQAQYVELRGQQIIVLAAQDGPRVFSASCPHLGCNVLWDTGEGLFRCPCHGAVFNGNGQVVKGPVSASLEKVPFELKDGKVIVT